jgi:hypothetical protein
MIFGFVSAAGSIIVTSFVYLLLIKNLPGLGIRLITTEQKLLLVRSLFAVRDAQSGRNFRGSHL